ncbi:hypothetical protein [Enterocloster bolteae]|uniref:hypothetical protein n=1 Tax=Enterocloster bolteae TaxID=208479 RepID=UPI002A833DA6|nr:hypothetical protein [Enterocloster bolteae]
MKKDESEQQRETIGDDAEREWDWVQKRGKYIDKQIPAAHEDEFEIIWQRVKKAER